MKNQLAIKINFATLMKFTLPTVIMMIFMSLYTMVDGIFVARFVNTTALSAINIVFPIISIICAIGIMLGCGASAYCATLLGQNEKHKAKQSFTLITLVGIIAGIFFSIIGIIFIDPILKMLGATSEIYQYCYDYMYVLLLFIPTTIMQMIFQFLFVTSGKPHIGLISTIIAGITNIVLDYVFIVPLDMGIAGAALATGIGGSIPAIVGLIYFSRKNKSTLKFVKPQFDMKVIAKTCGNGSSEMVTNLATAVTTLLFNTVMIKIAGEDGVAAITIVLYAQFLLTALYLGFSSGVAPLFAYNYGEKNAKKLKNLFRISMLFISISSVVIFICAIMFASPIATIFSEIGSNVYNLSVVGMRLFAFSFLFSGINIFTSGMFTAYSNGRISALISFFRTFIFICSAIIILPQFWEINGVWLAIPIAEAVTLIGSLFFLYTYRIQYMYGLKK